MESLGKFLGSAYAKSLQTLRQPGYQREELAVYKDDPLAVLSTGEDSRLPPFPLLPPGHSLVFDYSDRRFGRWLIRCDSPREMLILTALAVHRNYPFIWKHGPLTADSI